VWLLLFVWGVLRLCVFVSEFVCVEFVCGVCVCLESVSGACLCVLAFTLLSD
jgi:hypothetical protein